MVDLQLLSHCSKLHKQVNNKGLLGRITRIKLAQLQSAEWLPQSPLVDWPHSYVFRFSKCLLAAILSIMKPYRLTFNINNLNLNRIQEGFNPLISILSSDYAKPSILKSLKGHSFIFLS